MTNLDYWSEYTQKEKYAIWMCLYMFFTIMEDDNVGFNKSLINEAANRIDNILKALFKDKTDKEICNMYPNFNDGDVLEMFKYMSQSKKDKFVNCLVKIRNDFDIMLTYSRVNGKDWVIKICNEINYNLNYNVFN
jgi:uncharacterized protein (DUF433 family)